MPKPYRDFTDDQWSNLYLKVMNKRTAGMELSQFKKNYIKSTKDEERNKNGK